MRFGKRPAIVHAMLPVRSPMTRFCGGTPATCAAATPSSTVSAVSNVCSAKLNAPGCCAVMPSDQSKLLGYSEAELAAVGDGADLGLGCGNPTAIASLRPGETVLDLGSGGGFDAFLAARAVGPTGRVIGVDFGLVIPDHRTPVDGLFLCGAGMHGGGGVSGAAGRNAAAVA